MPGDTYTYILPSGTTFEAKRNIVASSQLGVKVRVYDIYAMSSVTGTILQLESNTTGSNLLLRLDIDGAPKDLVGSGSLSFCEGFVFPNGLYVTSGTGFQGGMITYAVEP